MDSQKKNSFLICPQSTVATCLAATAEGNNLEGGSCEEGG